MSIQWLHLWRQLYEGEAKVPPPIPEPTPELKPPFNIVHASQDQVDTWLKQLTTILGRGEKNSDLSSTLVAWGQTRLDPPIHQQQMLALLSYVEDHDCGIDFRTAAYVPENRYWLR